MENSMPFGEILDQVDRLPIGEQESLRDILSKRIIEQRREQLVGEIKEARGEYQTGQCQRTNVDELMSEIMA